MSKCDRCEISGFYLCHACPDGPRKERRSEHPIKKWIMKWYWRISQIGQITGLALMALTFTTVLSDKIQWRFGNPYESYLLTLTILGAVILLIAYVWDKKARMWHEQAVIGVERNPYAERKMMPKELYQSEVVWIPMLEKVGNMDGAAIMRRWIHEQLDSDPILRLKVEDMRRHFQP